MRTAKPPLLLGHGLYDTVRLDAVLQDKGLEGHGMAKARPAAVGVDDLPLGRVHGWSWPQVSAVELEM